MILLMLYKAFCAAYINKRIDICIQMDKLEKIMQIIPIRTCFISSELTNTVECLIFV